MTSGLGVLVVERPSLTALTFHPLLQVKIVTGDHKAVAVETARILSLDTAIEARLLRTLNPACG